MKKKLSILSILLVLALALCLFAACSKGTAKATVLKSEEEVLVIRADETKENVSFGDVLQSLKDSGEIQFEATQGNPGLFVHSKVVYSAPTISMQSAHYTNFHQGSAYLTLIDNSLFCKMHSSFLNIISSRHCYIIHAMIDRYEIYA